MRHSTSSSFAAIALTLLSAPALALNHAVAVGGAGLVFTPASVTIHVGDTVTFTNAGGFHNVVDDGGAYTCAVNCAAGGTPSSAAWSSTVTFGTPGTFPYHCAVHQGSGMVGTVIVQATTPVTLESFGVE